MVSTFLLNHYTAAIIAVQKELFIMSNANPSRIGQQLGTGDARALFLKIFSGEVLTTFNTNTVMASKVRVRNITSGKSALI